MTNQNSKKLSKAQARFLGKIAQHLVERNATEFKGLVGGIATPTERVPGGWMTWMAYGRGERVALDGICLSGYVVNVGETAFDSRWALVAPRAEVEAVNAFCGLVGRAVYLAEYGS
jgi:hypothetical protein